MKRFADFFAREGILSYGCVPYDASFVTREKYLADRYTGARRTLCAFSVPYYVQDPRRNLSVYAVPRDYHLYFSDLFARLEEYVAEHVPGAALRGFADTSPFHERALADACGIGSVGDHGLLIHPVYGSFVFLGSVVTDLVLTPPAPPVLSHARECTHCGACRRKCPSPELCLSRITQTKGELSSEHRAMIAASGCAWGCDVCQSVCPANRDLPDSPILFFREERIPFLTAEELRAMPEEAFERRAYAWKGRACILRNLELLEQS